MFCVGVCVLLLFGRVAGAPHPTSAGEISQPDFVRLQYISDPFSYLLPGANASLNRIIAPVASRSKVAVAIVYEFIGANTIDAFAWQLEAQWHLGKSDTLFVLSVHDRLNRISTGQTAKARYLSDARAASILSAAIPSLKVANYTAAVDLVVRDIVGCTRTGCLTAASSDNANLAEWEVVVIIVAIIVVVLMMAYVQKGSRGSSGGFTTYDHSCNTYSSHHHSYGTSYGGGWSGGGGGGGATSSW
eukprot:NODE_531_length_868_cov_244.189262_g523_i0.p1 GENE.NODE_531_length_868_cov_244.189262_g523_i0~~NODE_531_length_868_cov_244.189262_g523_i0.p1  ORF type:complete len:245 (-),score=0.04 NODE_531_length_868_cov_244.189262_g523_i0:82-816(-)